MTDDQSITMHAEQSLDENRGGTGELVTEVAAPWAITLRACRRSSTLTGLASTFVLTHLRQNEKLEMSF